MKKSTNKHIWNVKSKLKKGENAHQSKPVPGLRVLLVGDGAKLPPVALADVPQHLSVVSGGTAL